MKLEESFLLAARAWASTLSFTTVAAALLALAVGLAGAVQAAESVSYLEPVYLGTDGSPASGLSH